MTPSTATLPTASRLRLYQLVSPALPVGAFSYSEGLEVLCQAGQLSDAPAVEGWITAELEGGVVPLEAAGLPGLMGALAEWRCAGASDGGRQALQAVLERDGWLQALREAPEVRAQQRQMGGSLLQLLADLGWPLPSGPMPPAPLAWPSAFAWAGLCLEISPLELVEAYLYGWVATQLSASVRLVPLGPTEAQRLQLSLAPMIAIRASQLQDADPGALWSSGVGAGLAQLSHGELYSRLFRS